MLHKSEIIVGDVNDTNILINITTIDPMLIDLDSFQVRHQKTNVLYCSDAGKPDYSSAALLKRKTANGGGYVGLQRTKHDDVFAFAVLFFQSLVGVHPFYSEGWRQKKGGDLERQIQEGAFPYSNKNTLNPPNNLDSAQIKKNVSILPTETMLIFERIFVDQDKNVSIDDLGLAVATILRPNEKTTRPKPRQPINPWGANKPLFTKPIKQAPPAPKPEPSTFEKGHKLLVGIISLLGGIISLLGGIINCAIGLFIIILCASIMFWIIQAVIS